MRKFFAWSLILIFLGSLFYIASFYLFEEQSFKTYTKVFPYTVKLYFPNNIKDPNKTVCDYVIPVEREIVASKINVPFKTLELLFQGPIEGEKKDGAYTTIPEEAILAFFAIQPEAIEVVIDYDKTRMDKCTHQLFVSQIESTLKQFDFLVPVLINPEYLIETIFIHERR